MDEAKKEARRKLLAEIAASKDALSIVPAQLPPSTKEHAALDAAAERLVPTFEAPMAETPGPPPLEDLDAGWEDDEPDEEDEVDEPEPELPDERLDPVAYAAAKEARDARVQARRERKRVKGEAKKARRKARADVAKGKQKSKGKRTRAPLVAKPASTGGESSDDALVPARAIAAIPSSAKKPMLSKTNTWMLAVAIVVFVAAAIFAAVVAR